MAELTPLNTLLNKQNNPEMVERTADILDEQKLTAEEFVDKLVKPIIELQDETKRIDRQAVKGISMGVTTYAPDENGIVPLPGADSQVGIFVNLLSPKIVSITGKLSVGLRATSTVGGSNTGEVVEVQVMTATEGSTDWSIGGKFTLNTKSIQSKEWDEVELTDYVGNGVHNVQLVAVGKRTGVTGYSETFTAVLTNMYLTCQQNYQTPIDVSLNKNFPIAYNVYGTIEKQLHLRISGSAKTETLIYDLGADIDSTRFTRQLPDDSEHGYTTHGVRKVEAWLTADDGQGNTLESPHLVNRFMVVNRETEGANLKRPYLLIQNEVDKAVNFVQTRICDYAVYSPEIDEDGNFVGNNGPDIHVMFLVTAYARDYMQEHPEEYFRMEQSVVGGTQNTLDITVEIEPREGEEEQKSFNAYFRAYSVIDGVMRDMLQDAQGVSNMYIDIDNSDSFAPTSGADFVLNPKVRNNTETHPATILNARKNNAEIASEWENFGFVNDGWITNPLDNQKVLRVPAGSRIRFAYNPFSQFLTTADSSMTLELDFAVRNMSDEDEQVIGANEVVNGLMLGLCIRPITGEICTASNTVEDERDFRWQEDNRVHISINIHNAIAPDMGDAYRPAKSDTGLDLTVQKVALIRVFVDGTIEREMKYSIESRNEFLTRDAYIDDGGHIHNGFVLGSDTADLDIYSIRCYRSMQLEADDVLRNYIATLPTSAEKLEARRENSIKSAGKVDIAKVQSLGKRCLVWHGSEPYYYASDAQRGWWEIFQYNEDGTLNRELSGTIAKETKKLKVTRQGSTANTYYYSNLQTKVKDLEDNDFIRVKRSDFHDSISVSEPYDEIDDETKEPTGRRLVDIVGGNLGKNYPIEQKKASYECEEDGIDLYILVPDGWVDGNGKYRGLGYMVTEGTPLAQKLVNKINYASSMQSHLCGCTRAYSDLHTAVCGKSPLQEAVASVRVAKYTEPFFFFVQGENDASPVYRGLGTFGAGKADKPTWGYVKKLHPKMMMVEGSDNNYTMTDFRAPWDSNVTYDVNGEGWMRAGLQHWDFDMGATDVYNEGTPDEYEMPKPALTALWREAYNFVYIHAPMIDFYAGTFVAFKDSAMASQQYKRIWCTEGADAFRLKRYDDVLNQWVDAGLEIGTTKTYEVFDLTTHKMTRLAYEQCQQKEDFEKLNQAFIDAIVADFRKYVGFYFDTSSIKFHYCFINHLMAGTDNCSKNTYYVSLPVAKTVTIDGETRECYLFQMHQDDVDTIGPTDNNGRSTKPYYIDRMHPFSDKDSSTSCYEGNNSAFFNLIELAYERPNENGVIELQSTMRKIFDAMSDIMASHSVAELPGFDGTAANTVWGFFHLYFFNIQRYFSATAFNEAARIRYEYPAMIGYSSRGPGARGILPITQSVGGQLQSEIQYYRRRLVLMASYADWGDFYDGGKTHKIGISEAADAFPLQAFHLPDSQTSNTVYKFTVRPHQYIYPTGIMGQTAVDPHVRLRPGQEYEMNLGMTSSNDTGMSLLGINYYTSIGNVGDLSVSPNIKISINGKRLTEFIAEPTKLYKDMETQEMVPAFRPGAIDITSTRLTRLSLRGCKQIGGQLGLGKLNRLQEVDARDTNINSVEFPSSTSLTTVRLGSLRNIDVHDMPSLQEFSLSDYSALKSVSVGENMGRLNTYNLVNACRSANAPLDTLHVSDIAWTNVAAATLMWMCDDVPNVSLSGSITMAETGFSPSITFDMKNRIIAKWGNVDEPDSPDNKGLSIEYNRRKINSASIEGNFYNDGSKSYLFEVKPYTAYDNSQTKIVWTATPSQYDGEFSMNATTGELTVTKLSSLVDKATITATIYRYGDTPLIITKEIEIYDRKAQLGDYVFADGTFSDKDDERKTVIGVCCYVAPRDGNGDIISKLFNPDDKQQRLMVACENVNAQASSGSNFTSWQWGCYPSTDDAYSLFYKDEGGDKVQFDGANQGLPSRGFYDIGSIVNITSTGLTADPTSSSPTSTSYIGDNNLRDENSTDGISNGGFALFSPAVGAGDGFAYNEEKSSVTARTLTDDLAALAGDGYKAGDVVNSGYAKTLKIIRHRNTILRSGLPEIGLDSGSLDIPVADSKSNVTELESLVDCITKLRSLMQSRGEENYNKWSQIYYPAASAAYAYQPRRLKSGEVLSNKFVAHNWFLPPSGLLARFYWYYRMGRSSSDAQQGYDIFSRAVNAGKFASFSASNYWSASEFYGSTAWCASFDFGGFSSSYKCGSFTVRAVAAF